MKSSAARIAISICAYDRYDVLPKAIESAAQQSLGTALYRILVVDNSPDHARALAISKRFSSIPNLTYIVEEIPGLSNARNVSASQCGTEFIAFMDDDAIASRTWLEEILKAFDSFGPDAAIVGGRVDPIWGAPRPLWLHDAMLGSLSVVNWGGNTRNADAREWFAGTNITFRAENILSHGGFATNLGRIGSGHSLMSNEEVHLIDRIRRAGGKLIYAPDAYVDHLVEPKRLTRDWFRKRAAWQAVSDFMMDPKRNSGEVSTYWRDTIKYFNSLPPHERTIRGFIWDTDDPELFRWQTSAIYMMSIMSLAGFEGAANEIPAR
jgi:glycosyltransferase involved in cell wall biosynthesis